MQQYFIFCRHGHFVKECPKGRLGKVVSNFRSALLIVINSGGRFILELCLLIFCLLILSSTISTIVVIGTGRLGSDHQ